MSSEYYFYYFLLCLLFVITFFGLYNYILHNVIYQVYSYVQRAFIFEPLFHWKILLMPLTIRVLFSFTCTFPVHICTVCLCSRKKVIPLIHTCVCMGTTFSTLRTISPSLWMLQKTRELVLMLSYTAPKIRPSPSADKSRFFFNCVSPCLIAPVHAVSRK